MTNAHALCPYCGLRPADSDDHIFPAFLGGSATIRACRMCNSTFGATFEARVSKALGPTFLMLMLNGIAPPPGEARWRNKHIDENGVSYDLLPDLRMKPSRLSVQKLETGGYRIMGADQKAIMKVAAGFAASGKGRYPAQPTTFRKELPVRTFSWAIPADTDLRKLGLKSMIATARRAGRLEAIGQAARSWLLIPAEDPEMDVRLSRAINPAVNTSSRPSHYVCVEGDPEARTVVGVFSLFEMLTLYVVLNADYSGPAFRATGRLDMLSHEEEFGGGEMAGIRMPARRILRFNMGLDTVRTAQRLDELLRRATGVEFLRLRLAPNWLEAKLMMSM